MISKQEGFVKDTATTMTFNGAAPNQDPLNQVARMGKASTRATPTTSRRQ
jgi:hypothetical protein